MKKENRRKAVKLKAANQLRGSMKTKLFLCKDK